jgi:hypothetical protein
MLDIKIENMEGVGVATFFREGKNKCQVDYNQVRICLINEDRKVGEMMVGQLLFTLEMDGTTFKKLDKKEMQVFGDFLETLQTGEANKMDL